MNDPKNYTFKSDEVKTLLQGIYDNSLQPAIESKQYPNISSILVNLASIHTEDRKTILSLLAAKAVPKKGTSKAAPSNWLAPAPNTKTGGASVASGSDPDCVFCDEKQKAKKATAAPITATNEAATPPTNTIPILPPEVLNPPPKKEEVFNPETAKMREADTVQKMLAFHGKGNVKSAELKARLIASCHMVQSGHFEPFDRDWKFNRLAQYIVDSFKPRDNE